MEIHIIQVGQIGLPSLRKCIPEQKKEINTRVAHIDIVIASLDVWGSPYGNEGLTHPCFHMGTVQSLTHFHTVSVTIWGLRKKSPNENTSLRLREMCDYINRY
jgi:hypothetical protein